MSEKSCVQRDFKFFKEHFIYQNNKKGASKNENRVRSLVVSDFLVSWFEFGC